MNDLISRDKAVAAVLGTSIEYQLIYGKKEPKEGFVRSLIKSLANIPQEEMERLTDDDFETIRIHLNACKERLCNQRRWKEADEYQRIIDRFMAFASAEPKHGKWIKADSQQYFRKHYPCFTCSECGYRKDSQKKWNYCPSCGAKMEEEHE